MNYKNDVLLIQDIILYNKPEINDVIKNLLLIQNFSIGELYSYLSKNLIFYEQENSPIAPSVTLCSSFNSLPSITLISCDENHVVFRKKIDSNTSVSYEFAIKNNTIAQIMISDKATEKLISTSYTTIVKSTYTVADTIIAILTYEPPQEQLPE